MRRDLRKMRFLLATTGLLALALASAAPARAVTTVIDGGTIHPITGPAIENGRLVFERGIIRAVGPAASVDVPDDARIVDASGLHVWPSMIDCNTSLGLTEIGSVRGTRDEDEVGQMNPNARAEVSLNVSSSHFPVTRANGILLAATLPSGAVVPGTAAAIALSGWTWEEVVRQAPLGLVIHWPRMADPPGGPGGNGTTGDEWVERLDEMMNEARAYAEGRAAGGDDRDADVRWESLRSVVSGETPVWVRAAALDQIRAALDWTEKHGLRMVLIDGNTRSAGDAWRVADELALRKIPVVCRTTRRPLRRWEPYDTCYSYPAKLHAAGVPIVFGSWSASNSRNLPAEAARAVAYGLPRAAAERGLTLAAAETLGLDELYGSLEVSKSATLLLVEGDLLETTMNVKRAWLDGREVDLESRHTTLWKHWRSRPAGEPSSEE